MTCFTIQLNFLSLYKQQLTENRCCEIFVFAQHVTKKTLPVG